MMDNDDNQKSPDKSTTSSLPVLDTKKSIDKENNLNDTMSKSNDSSDTSANVPLSNVDININDDGDHSKPSSAMTIVDEKQQITCPENNENGLKTEDNSVKNEDEDDDDDEKLQEAELIKEEVENDPNFAVICSFLEKFGESLELKYSIKHLKTIFEDYDKVRPDLIDLHIKLLRKRKKYINKEKWEKALMRFCMEYSNLDAWELERFGYANIKLSLRLRIFLRLLETMFDYNQKFKSELNSNLDTIDLRCKSIGRDLSGFKYWYQSDSDLNFRLYKDEPDEDNSWSLVSKNVEELNECIEQLSKQNIEDFKQVPTPISEESISNPASQIPLKPLNEDNEEEETKENGQIDAKMTEECDEVKSQPSVNQAESCINDDQDLLPIKTEVKVEDIKEEEEQEENYESDGKNEVQSDDDDDQVIKSIYESIISEIVRELNETEENNESNKIVKKVGGGGNRRRGKRRSSRWSNRKKPAKKKAETTPDDEQPQQQESLEPNEKIPIENTGGKSCNDAKVSENVEESVAKKPSGRKRRSELDKLKEDFAEGLQAKRCSRRIQALHEKKLIEMQEEQKRLEKEMQEKRRKKEAAMAAKAAAELAAQLASERSNDQNDEDKDSSSSSSSSDSDSEIDDKFKGRKRKNQKRKNRKKKSDDDYQSDADDIRKKGKKRKRRKKGGRKGANPWEDESDSDDDDDRHVEHEDYYEEYMHDDYYDDEQLPFNDNDNEDEFACEEIDPEAEPVVIRRARTVKKSKDDFMDNADFLENFVNDDKPCGKCGKFDNPQWILLCDKCDEGYHTSCLRPPLFLIPSGDWFCPPCEHKLLIENLREKYQLLIDEIEKRSAEKLKSKKRWRYNHCEISEENILEEKPIGDHQNEVNDADDDNNNEQNADDVKQIKHDKTTNQHRKGVRRRKPNGWLESDEIADILDENSNDFIVGDDDVEYYDGRNKNKSELSMKNRRSSKHREEYSDDYSSNDDDDLSNDQNSNSFSDSDEDELVKVIRRDENNHRRKSSKHKHHHHHREKHIDINDFSRSGLKLRSARKRKPINYLFKEYDDLIKSAILLEENETEGYGYDETGGDGHQDNNYPRSKGKDINNILEQADKEIPDFSINPFDNKNDDNQVNAVDNVESTIQKSVENVDEVNDNLKCEKSPQNNDKLAKKQPQQQQKKKKSLTNLDFSDEDDQEEGSDEDFNMADDDEDFEMDEELTEVEDDNQDTELSECDSDFSSSNRRRRRSSRIQRNYSFKSDSRRKKNRKSAGHRRKRKRFVVDSDEDLTTDADEDDDDEDEISCDGSYSDESSDFAPRVRRAAQLKRVSYREDSSSDGEDEEEYHQRSSKTNRKLDKYQLDDDYNEDEEEEEQEGDDDDGSKASNKTAKDDDDNQTKIVIKLNEPNPNLNASIKTYSTRRDEGDNPNKNKRKLRIDSDDENDNDDSRGAQQNDEDKSIKKSKTADDNEPKVHHDDKTPANEAITKAAEAVSANESTVTLPNSTIVTTPTPTRTAPVSNPLSSIQEMNSKLTNDLVRSSQPPPPPSSSPSVSFPPKQQYQQSYAPPPPPVPQHPSAVPRPPPPPGHFSLPPPPPQPGGYPPPQVHGQHHPPPEYSQQYLPRAHSYGYPPSQPRPNLSPHGHSHQYYGQSSPVRYPHPPPPPPNPSGDGKQDSNYTLTNLDSYHGLPPSSKAHGYPANYSARPPMNYTPPQTSPNHSPPPKILNLDGPRNPYPGNKHPPGPPPPSPSQSYYPSGHHGYDPNVAPSHPYPDYYQSQPPPPPPQGGPPSHGYYATPPPPPPHPHPSSLQRMPSHVGPRAYPTPQGPPPPPPIHYMPPRNVSPRQEAPRPPPPPSLQYPPPASNSLPSASPYQYHPPGPPMPSPHGYPQPHPAPYNHPHHPSLPYPPGAVTSNGGFMIQNLLHNRPPAATVAALPVTTSTNTCTTKPTICAVKSSPKASKSAPKTTKKTNESKVKALDNASPIKTSIGDIGGKVTKSRKKSTEATTATKMKNDDQITIKNNSSSSS